jgi:hypothetical protein
MSSRTSSREKPRISSLKMGEYLHASAPQRERILRNQKYPPVVQLVPYERARQSIRAALLSTKGAANKLLNMASSLEQQVPKTAYDSETLRLSALAIRCFAALLPSIQFNGALPVVTVTPHFILRVEGVAISVSPSVILRRVNRRGRVESGALLLAIRKGEVLDERSGIAVGEMLRLSLTQNGYQSVKPMLCVVADVFGGAVYSAPSRSQRLGSEIESACREIAVRWPSIPDRRVA